MEKPQTNITISFGHWNRRILNAYWLIISIAALAVIVSVILFPSPLSRTDQIIDSFLTPNLQILPAMILAEVGDRYLQRLSSNIILALGTFVSSIMVLTFSELHGVQLILLIPLFTSVLYFQKRKIIFAFVLNFLSFILLHQWVNNLQQLINDREYVLTCSIFFGVGIMCYSIMGRGIEIQNSLITTMRAQQDLLVQNTIMDRITKVDALTGLYNHKTFHEYLDKLAEQSERYRLPMHLAIFDIDNFKRINDTYGHWVGDIILKRVGKVISDSVTSDDFAARYGGEEFAVIYTDKTADDAYLHTENIRKTIAGMVHEELNGQSVTISIGLEHYRFGSGKELLFKGADAALYQAKRTGKNKTVIQEQPARDAGSG